MKSVPPSRSNSPSRTQARVRVQAAQAVAGKRQHRACKHCRDHRIKCVPVPGEERCKKCIDHDKPCDKNSAAPKDDRPRRRTLFRGGTKGASSLAHSQGYEPSYLGSSSLSILVWKYVPQTTEVIDRLRSIDDRYDLHRGSIGGLEQNGLLVGQGDYTGGRAEKPTLVSVSGVQAKLNQELGAQTVLANLYETCRDRIIPFFPVISVSESLLADKATPAHVDKYAAVDPRSTPPTPLPHIVRMVHCAIASCSRDVPERIRQSVRTSLHSLLLGPEMVKLTSTRCLGSVQVLLLLSMCEDLNGSDAGEARETAWQNIGTASRTAFALALHRNISTTHVPYFQLNRRLRVWGAAICMDRWAALRMGRPFAIDLADCDAPLPRYYADGIRDGELTSKTEPVFPCFRFLNELTRLSILLGRAYKLVGSPSGLQTADDLNFLMLQVDIDTWEHQLPTTWPYSIKLVLRQAPLLMNLCIVVLEFTFQRSFLWPTTPIPAQLTFRPSRDRWVSLCQRAEQAVYWLNTPDGSFYLDIWSNMVYAAFCCVIIHLKAFEESQDPHHRWLLELANTVIQQWASQQSGNQTRARLAALSDLLSSLPGQAGFTAQPLGDVHELFADTILPNSGELDMDPQLSFLEQLGLEEFGFGP